MLEKLELLEVDEDTSALRLKFPSPLSGNYPVIMEVGKSYGDHVVFKNTNLLTIERGGDKVAFVGKNGEGKSTLVKCIMKEIEHEGTLTIGTQHADWIFRTKPGLIVG